MPPDDDMNPDQTVIRRETTPPRFGPPEEVDMQLDLLGTAERQWLGNRGWSGPKLEEIIRLRSHAREEKLAELSRRKGVRRTSRLSKRSDVKSLLMGSPRQLQNQRIALKYQGDFKRARNEISELLSQIGLLEGVPYPTWALTQRVKPSPEVDYLAEQIGEMAVADENEGGSGMDDSV
ncbi:hypothetical protein V5O48_007121 [Marasmius crinis-equi]|uniref:Uncharacterized protein n=1 Tax=Marasmius crinis-equi TaxID=585013 RepID=A0ABR3FHL0_9AGAR